MDAADLLWTDATLYRRRYEKSAAALIAVQRALRQAAHLPGAPEFLRLYDFVAGADPEPFTQLWRDPAAYHWVRRTVQLLADHFDSRPRAAAQTLDDRAALDHTGAALSGHLRSFAKFALGLGFLTGRDLVLAEPLDVELPAAFPGTELVLTGGGRVRIRSVLDGGLEIDDPRGASRIVEGAGGFPGAPRLQRCPIASVGNARVAMNAPALRISGLEFSDELTDFGLEFQQRHLPLVSAALDAIQRFHPGAFSHLAEIVRVIVVKPAREGSFGTLSSSELPGAFVCSVPTDPLALAADFIHELHHNRLFFIEEGGPLFASDGDDAIEGEHHYSPWRDAPRPLHGLLHAAYVYLPVFQYWSAIWRAGALAGAQRDYACDQLARIPVQVRIGVNQLQRHAHFTPLGSTLFAELAREAARIEGVATTLGVSVRSPAVTCRSNGALRPVVDERSGRPLTVGQTVLDHLERRDLRGECEAERVDLARALGRP